MANSKELQQGSKKFYRGVAGSSAPCIYCGFNVPHLSKIGSYILLICKDKKTYLCQDCIIKFNLQEYFAEHGVRLSSVVRVRLSQGIEINRRVKYLTKLFEPYLVNEIVRSIGDQGMIKQIKIILDSGREERYSLHKYREICKKKRLSLDFRKARHILMNGLILNGLSSVYLKETDSIKKARMINKALRYQVRKKDEAKKIGKR